MARGGYRMGAGRPARHFKVEQCLSLDARRLAREGVLLAAASAWRVWTWREAETGRIKGEVSFRVEPCAVSVVYVVQRQPMTQRIPILSTPCRFGGHRQWFGCPCCGGRVAILYMRVGSFACRKCHRLVYASQSEDEIGRLRRRQAKLERRVTWPGPRPRGMHTTTRDKLLERIFDCEERREHLVDEGIERLLRRAKATQNYA